MGKTRDFRFSLCASDKFGQRAFVGKVSMDKNDSFPEYKETTEESITETERYVCLHLCGRHPLSGTDGAGDGEETSEPGGMCTHVAVWVCPPL